MTQSYVMCQNPYSLTVCWYIKNVVMLELCYFFSCDQLIFSQSWMYSDIRFFYWCCRGWLFVIDCYLFRPSDCHPCLHIPPFVLYLIVASPVAVWFLCRLNPVINSAVKFHKNSLLQSTTELQWTCWLTVNLKCRPFKQYLWIHSSQKTTVLTLSYSNTVFWANRKKTTWPNIVFVVCRSDR
jgi:hypothetical protein